MENALVVISQINIEFLLGLQETLTWMLLPINIIYGNEWRYLLLLPPLQFCWWSDAHAHTTFWFCLWRRFTLLSHLLAGVTTDLHVFHQQVLILIIPSAQPCPSCAETRCHRFYWWTCKGFRELHRQLSCVMPCTLTHGNPPHMIHRWRVLCTGIVCMCMIPTLDVLQEEKSAHLSVHFRT